MTSYIIEQKFEGDGEASAITRAAAWLVLNGSGIDEVTVVGQLEQVSVFYRQKVAEVPSVNGLRSASPATGSVSLVSGGSKEYTFTTGA